MKYIETIYIAFIIIIQWILLIVIFSLFWGIVTITLYPNNVIDQLVKLVIGLTLLGIWLLEWFYIVNLIYNRIRRCI
ncbi:MAG TPA: hypothetical protein ENF47_01510 [Thermoprotei archaeon]|nr:hypothetical protein [Thermoprotei archaeon]